MARRLTRDVERGVIAGVAAGIARYADIDPLIVRLGFVILIFASGIGLLMYPVCWFLMPRDERPAEPGAPSTAGTATDRFVAEARETGERVVGRLREEDSGGRGQLIIGGVLIAVGGLFLLDRFPWFHWIGWWHWHTLWPLILIGVGIAMLSGARRSQA